MMSNQTDMKIIRHSAIVFFIFISMNSCKPKETVDLIVKNGIIYTVDAGFSVAESFAVKDGKITAVGSGEEISGNYRADHVIDVSGKFVYPGFNDAHCHFCGYGANLMQYADLVGTSSPAEIYGILQEHHQKFSGAFVYRIAADPDNNIWICTNQGIFILSQ